MSRSYEYSYEIERQRRQQLYNARVSATTEKFYSRYMEQYNQMFMQGFDAYIPDEMNRLKSDLASIRNYLVSNPTEARDISYDVGSYIKNMFSIGNAAIVQYERNERMKKEEFSQEVKENSSELLKVYYDTIQSIKNPITRNFARPKLEELKKTIVNELKVSTSDLQSWKQNLLNKINGVIKEAEVQTKEWKKQKSQESLKDNLMSQIDDLQESINNENIENQKKANELLNQIKKLRSQVELGEVNAEQLKSKVKDVDKSVNDTVISESVRREMVKSVIKSLRVQEFSVNTPEIIKNENGNFVKIIAKKPSGKRAECRVDLHGKIKYKFDSYEGMTCLKDIEKFNVDLEKVYSIKLSDERILWENPIRISKDEKPIGNEERRNV